jgi:hypothetical protein
MRRASRDQLWLAAGWTCVVLFFWFVLFRPSTVPGVPRFVAVDLGGYFHPKFL